MTSRLKALLAGVVLACSQAHAGVIYSWHNVSNGPDALPKGMILELEFSEAAVAAGSLDYVLDPCGWAEFCGPDPDAPVTRFLFGGVTRPINYAPSTRPMRPHAMLNLSVRFEPNGHLSGFISANDSHSDITLGSRRGLLFTVDGVHSDIGSGGGCDLWSDDCRGARGYLRTGDAQPIPEPGSIALFAAALFGAALAGRRRSAGAPPTNTVKRRT